MRIFLIDDEWNSLDLLDRMLQSLGIEPDAIVRFQEPLEAIPHVLAIVPDVLFIDLEMPRLNGVDLILMLSHLPSHFVLVTGGDASQWIETQAPGRTRQLQKPFSVNDLKNILQSIAIQSNTTAKNPNL
ncbi:MAG: response regulator [Bacteroidetes bacterium]|nr:response regulator [Bacteroidota bacterium]